MMGKAPYVMKRFLDLSLALIIVGAVVACGALVQSWVGNGTIMLEMPVQLEENAGPTEVSNDVLGDGWIGPMTGMAEFPADASAVHSAVFLFAVFSSLAPALVVVVLLRRIAMTVVAGEPFDPANTERIRAIGLFVMAFEFVRGAATLGIETAMMATSKVPGFALRSLGEWDFSVFVLGVVILALAEVFRYGMQLQADVDLTV